LACHSYNMLVSSLATACHEVRPGDWSSLCIFKSSKASSGVEPQLVRTCAVSGVTHIVMSSFQLLMSSPSAMNALMAPETGSSAPYAHFQPGSIAQTKCSLAITTWSGLCQSQPHSKQRFAVSVANGFPQ